MLQPKKTDFRKSQRGNNKGLAWRGDSVVFGDYGIKALQGQWIKAKQIEASRTVMSKHISKMDGKMWIRVFPSKSVTKKPEGRMGNGKGEVEYWAVPVKPGCILFEMEGIPFEIAKRIWRLASHKLPIKTKLSVRQDCSCSC